MRIYSNAMEAVREVERDVYEMGIMVHPQTMQDKQIDDDPDYATKEVTGYGYKIVDHHWISIEETAVVNYILTGELLADVHPETIRILNYINAEFNDRLSGQQLNPGTSWSERPEVWTEFLHDGKFAYTYSERMTPQLDKIKRELRVHPDTRQAVINIHSNVAALPGWYSPADTKALGHNIVWASTDCENTGGAGRIPCSMYYQFLRRGEKLDLIYTMRSCDLLVHYPVDLMLALRLQSRWADDLGLKPGTFTHFIGSLHAYQKDLKRRGIF